ncbi:MAG: ribosomal protein S18-alanine N-acetyltransferase [Candidatus Aminicenantia bacterium]
MGKCEEKLKLRKMRFEDIDRVVEIERKSFSNPWSRDAFIYEIESEVSYPWVVELDNEIVGYSVHWLIIDEAHLSNIAVDPLHRGKGIGRFILEKVIESIRKKGAKFITLEVRVSNRIAIALYTRMNFKIAGIRKNYYINPVEDAFIMIKNI